MKLKVKHLGIAVALVGLLLTTTVVAAPSRYVGQIAKIRLSDGGESPARVGVYVGEKFKTACNNGWFGFEDADKYVGALWSAGLLSAMQKNKRVDIQGTGKCDRFQVEGIKSIDFHR